MNLIAKAQGLNPIIQIFPQVKKLFEIILGLSIFIGIWWCNTCVIDTCVDETNQL